ncbi:ferric-chelate reductase 1 -like protein, partial [Brachionus plicatilis]
KSYLYVTRILPIWKKIDSNSFFLRMRLILLVVCFLKVGSIHPLEIDTTGCDKQFGCFRQPSGCDGKNCDYFVSWKNEGDSINFIMSTKVSSNNAYLAIGFSKDSTMGDDSVVMCFNERINSNDIQLFYNYDRYSDILDFDRPNLGLSGLKISQEDNFLLCSFKREKFLYFKNYFDLNKPYYLLIAKGQATFENSRFVPDYHGENRLKSSSPIDFRLIESASVSSSSINLVKAHGSLNWFNFLCLKYKMYPINKLKLLFNRFKTRSSEPLFTYYANISSSRV